MKHLRERAALGALLLGLPVVYLWRVVSPAKHRLDALRQRIQGAESECRDLPHFAPLTPEERALIQDSEGAWRQRIPRLSTEQQRLAHYHGCVGGLEKLWRQGGVTTLGFRSSWDPIRASFTLPKGVDSAGSDVSGAPDTPESRVSGWVLESEIAGPTERLFKALALSSAARPLFEPVGLRWENTEEGKRQHLILRNLVLEP